MAEIKELRIEIRTHFSSLQKRPIAFKMTGILETKLTFAEVEAAFSKTKTAKLRFSPEMKTLIAKILETSKSALYPKTLDS